MSVLKNRTWQMPEAKMRIDGPYDCPCRKKSCKRKGKGDECIEYHKTRKREPYCSRKKAGDPYRKEG